MKIINRILCPLNYSCWCCINHYTKDHEMIVGHIMKCKMNSKNRPYQPILIKNNDHRVKNKYQRIICDEYAEIQVVYESN